MKLRPAGPRKALNAVIIAVSGFSAALGVAVLAWIVVVLFKRGFDAVNWDFFTELPTPPGMGGGGLANAIAGSLLVVFLATVMALPPGILTGVYLAEFGGNGKFASWVRFAVSMLMSIPSIITGLVIWGLIVVAMGTFSAWAGAVSLALIMIPIVAGTTEDMLKLVPDALRESALAMGASYPRMLLLVFRSAKKGLITGILLAVARVSGETAPLLFTALNSPYWPKSLSQPTANLPVTIFNYAMSPYSDWQAKAWGASLLITAGVLALSIISRLSFSSIRKGMTNLWRR